MANVLTALAPVLYTGGREVARELTGFLGAVRLDFDDKGVAKGDSVKVPVVPVMTAASVTPSMTWSAGADRTPTTIDLTLSNEREVSWNLTANEEQSLLNGSQNAQEVLRQTIAQGFRTIANEVEAYVGVVAKNASSRAYGTAGTAPFATTVADAAQIRKILKDNGIPDGDLSLVFDTNAGVNFASLGSLYKANEAGSDSLLREGELGRLFKMGIRESAGVAAHTKGAGTGALVNNASGYAVGATSIVFDTMTVNTTGIKAGDVVTFTGDTNKYIVKTGSTATGGTIVLQEPGLRIAVADNVAITVGNSYAANIALHRNAVAAVIRPSLQPASADVEQMVLVDAKTGLAVLLIRKVGSGMASWYMRAVYDAFAPNPFAIGTLLG